MGRRFKSSRGRKHAGLHRLTRGDAGRRGVTPGDAGPRRVTQASAGLRWRRGVTRAHAGLHRLTRGYAAFCVVSFPNGFTSGWYTCFTGATRRTYRCVSLRFPAVLPPAGISLPLRGNLTTEAPRRGAVYQPGVTPRADTSDHVCAGNSTICMLTMDLLQGWTEPRIY